MATTSPHVPERASQPPAIMLVEECLALAGVTRRTLYRWHAEGRFKAHRPIAAGSSRLIIDRESFMRFLFGEAAR